MCKNKKLGSLVKDTISCSACSCTITSNSMQCSLCQIWVH